MGHPHSGVGGVQRAAGRPNFGIWEQRPADSRMVAAPVLPMRRQLGVAPHEKGFVPEGVAHCSPYLGVVWLSWVGLNPPLGQKFYPNMCY